MPHGFVQPFSDSPLDGESVGDTVFFNLITKALTEEEKVQIVGFGAFETKVRAERMGRNPKTGEDIPIPATKVPVFKAGKALKDAVDQ